MKQVIQSFDTGELEIADVPTPVLRAGGILVRTCASLISAGTERMVLEFAEKNMLQKAQARPDLVKQVLDKVKREGLLTTIASVRNKLGQPLPLGYSSSGIVVEVGSDAQQYKVGDRVACAGSGYACHSELAYVPKNMTAKLPGNVSYEAGAFGTLGAIALQGIRQANVELGHNVAVVGLGLLGQLTIQMLKAAGCRTFGIDLNHVRVEQAIAVGADSASLNANAVAKASEFTNGRGFDAVIVTADTKSSEPIALAGEISRDRGVVVAVGGVGLDIPRRVFYEKELDFRLSRSYGPGRYDAEYEERGHDYPYGYVRWTQQRNIEAFLQMVSSGQVILESLITHRFQIDDAFRAYELISGKTGEAFTGVVLIYPQDSKIETKINIAPHKTVSPDLSKVRIGVLGAGNFANATLLPAIKRLKDVEFVGIASGSGLSAKASGKKFGFQYCTSQEDEIFADKNVNTVVVLTRHDLHGRQIIAALDAGKNVFVEKPLVISPEEMQAVVVARELAMERAASSASPAPAVMVGFNRRFAPHVLELRKHLCQIKEPLMFNYRVNAGFIPLNLWPQDKTQGGGRLIGEGCHFIDLLSFLADSPLLQIQAISLPDVGRYAQDNLLITMQFENGSLGTITYVASGNKSFGKEMLEVFGGGLAARLDDYRTLHIDGPGGSIHQVSRFHTDKGHFGEWQAFVEYLSGRGPLPIPFEEIINSMRATFAAKDSLQLGRAITL